MGLKVRPRHVRYCAMLSEEDMAEEDSLVCPTLLKNRSFSDQPVLGLRLWALLLLLEILPVHAQGASPRPPLGKRVSCL